MTKFSTNALTARYCAMRGYPCETVQSWRGNKRHDLFGVADTLALLGHMALLIQNCHEGSIPAHRRKLAEMGDIISKLYSCGFHLELWEWKRKKHNGRYQWFLRAEDYMPEPTGRAPWIGPLDLYPKKAKADGLDVRA